MAKRTRGIVPLPQPAIAARLVTLEDVLAAIERLEQHLLELRERNIPRGHMLICPADSERLPNTGPEYQSTRFDSLKVDLHAARR